jgi:hypothetical protein
MVFDSSNIKVFNLERMYLAIIYLETLLETLNHLGVHGYISFPVSVCAKYTWSTLLQKSCRMFHSNCGTWYYSKSVTSFMDLITSTLNTISCECLSQLGLDQHDRPGRRQPESQHDHVPQGFEHQQSNHSWHIQCAHLSPWFFPHCSAPLWKHKNRVNY